jgi:hypothetical protein
MLSVPKYKASNEQMLVSCGRMQWWLNVRYYPRGTEEKHKKIPFRIFGVQLRFKLRAFQIRVRCVTAGASLLGKK